MTLDRAILAFAGTMVLLSLALTYYVHPGFVWLTAFVGANLIQSSFTGFCPAAMLFKRIGADRMTAMKRLPLLGMLVLSSMPITAVAGNFTLQSSGITEWKAVYGQVEARDSVIARARIGGTV
eukprot:gene60899-83293_t